MARRVVAALALALVAAPAAPGAAAPRCAAWELEYALGASLELSDTPLHQGDGIVPIGPGRLTLRFEDERGAPGGRVAMLRYEMRDLFTLKTRTLFWNTTVKNDTRTRATPDASGVVARGTLSGGELRWSTPVSGYRVDGKVTCTGAMCGKFGAPPPGTSEIRIGPSPVQFSTFRFGPGLRKLSMPFTLVTKTKLPKQTSRVALEGRETKRTCVAR